MATSGKVTLRSETAISPVNPDQALKASKALLAHMIKASKETAARAEKKDLFADSEDAVKQKPIWLSATTKRFVADKRNLKPGKISLPHPLNTDPDMRICVIVAEPQRAYKNVVASDDFPSEWRKRITRIIDISKLKSKFRAYEAQRKLFADHEVFLGDSRIINRLPQTLGKTFYKSTAKRPIPVDIEARIPKVDGKRVKRAKDSQTPNVCTPVQFAGEVERAVGAAIVNRSPSTQIAVKVGNAGFTPEQLAANVEIVSNVLANKYISGKWNNIKSLHLKGPETVALPLWLTDELWLDEKKDVVADESEEAKGLMSAGEKANVGKKRKSVLEKPSVPEAKEPPTKKAKKTKSTKPLRESDDSKLDLEMAGRKEALKKQKKAARKALEV